MRVPKKRREETKMTMRTAVIVGLLCLLSAVAWAQFGQPGMGGPPMGPGMGGGMMGMGGPGMGGGMMGGMGAMHAPVMMVVDGIVYIAYGGKLTAFDAKTLDKIAEATYQEPPMPRGMMPGGAGGPLEPLPEP